MTQQAVPWALRVDGAAPVEGGRMRSSGLARRVRKIRSNLLTLNVVRIAKGIQWSSRGGTLQADP